MPIVMNTLLKLYLDEIKKLYGNCLKQVILYGSYARGDFNEESDVDIMILLNITDLEAKKFQHQLSAITFDFNMAHDTDIKPIMKSDALFHKWMEHYPFYKNICREGITLYGATNTDSRTIYRSG